MGAVAVGMMVPERDARRAAVLMSSAAVLGRHLEFGRAIEIVHLIDEEDDEEVPTS
jgi:hypothetical protein